MIVLECKIRQASLLTYPNLVIQKGLETYADASSIRHRLILNTHAPSSYLKNSINAHEHHAKQKIEKQIKKLTASNIEDKILHDIELSIEGKETQTEYQKNTKLLRDDNLQIEVKNVMKQVTSATLVLHDHH